VKQNSGQFVSVMGDNRTPMRAAEGNGQLVVADVSRVAAESKTFFGMRPV
jgi:hypothetical protein